MEDSGRGEEGKTTRPFAGGTDLIIQLRAAAIEADRVVDIKHSERMAKALRKRNKSHIFLELEDGDHGLSLQRNRMKFFEALESFLEKRLNHD